MKIFDDGEVFIKTEALRHIGDVALDVALCAQRIMTADVKRAFIGFEDIGNMTAAEVDQLFEVLIEFKQRGHFSRTVNNPSLR